MSPTSRPIPFDPSLRGKAAARTPPSRSCTSRNREPGSGEPHITTSSGSTVGGGIGSTSRRCRPIRSSPPAASSRSCRMRTKIPLPPPTSSTARRPEAKKKRASASATKGSSGICRSPRRPQVSCSPCIATWASGPPSARTIRSATRGRGVLRPAGGGARGGPQKGEEGFSADSLDPQRGQVSIRRRALWPTCPLKASLRLRGHVHLDHLLPDADAVARAQRPLDSSWHPHERSHSAGHIAQRRSGTVGADLTVPSGERLVAGVGEVALLLADGEQRPRGDQYAEDAASDDDLLEGIERLAGAHRRAVDRRPVWRCRGSGRQRPGKPKEVVTCGEVVPRLNRFPSEDAHVDAGNAGLVADEQPPIAEQESAMVGRDEDILREQDGALVPADHAPRARQAKPLTGAEPLEDRQPELGGGGAGPR